MCVCVFARTRVCVLYLTVADIPMDKVVDIQDLASTEFNGASEILFLTPTGLEPHAAFHLADDRAAYIIHQLRTHLVCTGPVPALLNTLVYDGRDLDYRSSFK